IKSTKYGIIDFFTAIASKQKPVLNNDHYVYKDWTIEEMIDMLKVYMPAVENNKGFQQKVSEWLAKDCSWATPKCPELVPLRSE
ncbi:uncharacterized protein BYT42DRAFT_625839, partial [Radiomyces spectabilis]|uniref:uncharacterized protein n=1 Tax=Radiomyces spectabilis TaxID=64574 RepID=UPI00221E416F